MILIKCSEIEHFKLIFKRDGVNLIIMMKEDDRTAIAVKVVRLDYVVIKNRYNLSSYI